MDYWLNYLDNGKIIATKNEAIFDAKKSVKITKEHYDEWMFLIGND